MWNLIQEVHAISLLMTSNSSRTMVHRWSLGCALAGFFMLGGFFHICQSFKEDLVLTCDGYVPPSKWEKLKQYELDLPQHDLNLPSPEGRNGRYVYFSSQGQGLGWNNQLNELLMENIVAYRSNRSYVFQDLIWNPDHFPWRQEDRRRCEKDPSSQQTPLSALLSGPTVGGFWDPGDNAPRSISQHWFNTVCPINERRIISTKEVKTAVYWDKGSVLFDAWQKVLSEAPERCIEVQGSPEDPFPQPFDTWLWAGEWVLSMWDRIKDSPVSRLLGPSPIIQAAVARNEYLFRPRGPRPPGAVSTNPYDGMVAAHVRRGDFEGHCRHLATWNSTFYSWNQLSFLSDRFIHPPNYEWGTQSEEGVRHYLKHCYPDMDAIVEKIRKSKADYVRAGKPNDYRHLNVIFILSDDQSEWLEDLKKSLRNDGWSTVVSTLDLVVDAEQREVGVAIDMELARKAALFIGNGWSSLTSNIVYRRLVDGRENMSIRFF